VDRNFKNNFSIEEKESVFFSAVFSLTAHIKLPQFLFREPWGRRERRPAEQSSNKRQRKLPMSLQGLVTFRRVLGGCRNSI
jgi:hypothetical protein